MEIEYSPSAIRDIEQCKKSGDEKAIEKITELLKSVKLDYKSGIGKPEPLKGDLSGWWSVRIDEKNRLIFKIENGEVKVYQCKEHYGDK